MGTTKARANQVYGVGLPEPYLREINPEYLPINSTLQIEVIGDFFTPTTTFAFSGSVTINSKTFYSSQRVLLSITTSAIEESVNLTINNGKSKTFFSAFSVLTGTVTVPTENDYVITQGVPDVSVDGNFVLTAESPKSIATSLSTPLGLWVISFLPKPCLDRTNYAGNAVNARTNKQFKLIDPDTGNVALEFGHGYERAYWAYDQNSNLLFYGNELDPTFNTIMKVKRLTNGSLECSYGSSTKTGLTLSDKQYILKYFSADMDFFNIKIIDQN